MRPAMFMRSHVRVVLPPGRSSCRCQDSHLARKAGFQWLRRWRRRHGVRLKRLRPLDTPAGEELAEKARVRGQPGSHRFRGRGRPISGPGRCRVQKTGDRFSVHFLGPRLRVAKENAPGKRPRFSGEVTPFSVFCYSLAARRLRSGAGRTTSIAALAARSRPCW